MFICHVLSAKYHVPCLYHIQLYTPYTTYPAYHIPHTMYEDPRVYMVLWVPNQGAKCQVEDRRAGLASHPEYVWKNGAPGFGHGPRLECRGLIKKALVSCGRLVGIISA